MRKIILGSTSPRRKEIFAKTRLPFIVEASDYEEDMTLNLPPKELALHLSLGKAKGVSKKHSDAVIIAADTFISYENKVLGKPHSPEEAIQMLTLLQGKSHQIITGVTIVDTRTGKVESFVDEAKVTLYPLTNAEIEAYVATGEPLDKAGSYAIQELGAVFVKKIEGDFFGAMGLPLSQVVSKLKLFGVRVL